MLKALQVPPLASLKAPPKVSQTFDNIRAFLNWCPKLTLLAEIGAADSFSL